MTNFPKHPVVVYKIATKVPQLILDADALLAAIQAHPTLFIIPATVVAEIAANIQALEDAESNLIAGTGTAATRDLKLVLVVSDINMLKLIVQTAVNANPAEAVDIAQKGGMRIKMTAIRQKVVFHAKNTIASGIVDIFAPGAPMRSFHEWAISTDGTNWQPLPTTIKATTTVTGLQAVTRQYFRHRVTTPKEGTGNWDQPYSLIIN